MLSLYSEQALTTALLLLHLAAITWWDFRKMIIPNLLNLSLGLCGAAVSFFLLQGSPTLLLVGAGAAYLGFNLFAFLYGQLRGIKVLGGGDIKLITAATFWIGLTGLPWMILAAALSGLAFVAVKSIAGIPVSMEQRIAFGPHLALGLALTWVLRSS
jgi:leader peptidase (prepilin peptidase) / N-methyltransferase